MKKRKISFNWLLLSSMVENEEVFANVENDLLVLLNYISGLPKVQRKYNLTKDKFCFIENYNFDENFTRLLNKSGWKSDGTNNVIYNEEDSIENSVVTVDGNSVFKAYTSKGKCTSVNFKGNKNIATAGVYELTIKVKGGPDANRLGSIGIRLFGQSFKVVDVRFTGVENITSTEWTTLKLTFTVKENLKSFIWNIKNPESPLLRVFCISRYCNLTNIFTYDIICVERVILCHLTKMNIFQIIIKIIIKCINSE